MSVSLSQSANTSTTDSTAGIRLVRVFGCTVNALAAFQQVRSGLSRSAYTLCTWNIGNRLVIIIVIWHIERQLGNFQETGCQTACWIVNTWWTWQIIGVRIQRAEPTDSHGQTTLNTVKQLKQLLMLNTCINSSTSRPGLSLTTHTLTNLNAH